MTSSDVILYYTTVGWMMWNWVVSTLAIGAAVVLYDGSPLKPTPTVLWDLVDSLCISQYSKDGEERVVLFLKMASGHSFQPGLVRRVQDAIRAGLSARHVPSLVLETKGIPYTLNGKKVEVAVKRVIAGEPAENYAALSNPETLDWYRHVPELQGF
uniref:Acetoacetyl-CoA synthetase n=1 Tax=Rousettus aegyptiacus TaxID=9407 RepID=A0A7J8GVK4_ROUAE|nr:acetoacetyl-CoA synthetase [Rousettus aegyptiacus]